MRAAILMIPLLALACARPNAVCGDGVRDPLEGCDDGPANADGAACTTACLRAWCGDGLVGPNEACDDGNAIEDDACRSDCHVCGDGIVGGLERCDDANDVLDDGCEACLSDGDPRRWFVAIDPRHVDASDELLVFHQPGGSPWFSTYALDGTLGASFGGPLAPVDGNAAYAMDDDHPVVACSTSGPTLANGQVAHVSRFDASGTVLWVEDMLKPSERDDESPGGLAVAPGHVALAGTYLERSTGNAWGLVHLLDEAGAPIHRATMRVRGEATVGLVVDVDARGEVVVGGLFDELASDIDLGWAASVAPDGAVRWTRELESVVSAVALRAGEVLVVTATRVERLDPVSGAPLDGGTALEVPADIHLRARFDDGYLIVRGGNIDGLWISVHAENGQMLWSAERDGSAGGDASLGDDGLLYVGGGGAIWVYDPHL